MSFPNSNSIENEKTKRKRHKNLPKSRKGDLREEEREDEMELAPHATPRVFWLIRFFLLPPILEGFDGDELSRIRLDLRPEEFAERGDSELMSPVEAKSVEEGNVAFKMRRQIKSPAIIL